MTTTKSYDYLNRLTQITNAPSGTGILPVSFNYSFNSANQRTHNTLADGSYWVYGFDSLGQVTNACKYFADGTLVPGQQFDYTFDTIGNRTQTLAGGDTNGANLRLANYYANNLNQLTNRDVPAYVDVMGASILTNAVAVNGTSAYRKEEYFRQQLAANNSSLPLWTNIIVSGGVSVTGNVYVAKQPEIFKYDPDGNLTNDGRWAYTWDGENRLKVMTVNTNVGPQYQLTFAYDAQGRRIQKIVATNGAAISTNNFLYDGWNLIAILNPQSSIIESFVWGSDISGSMQGAGGVGGLLEVSYYGSSTTNCFPAYDGNGNVMALVNAADGTLAANYEYGPFGEPIRITGAMANNSPFLFSTKYYDSESGLYYYGYRFYNPTTGTWPNRDPLEEDGGLNLYGFVVNNSLSLYDLIGLTGCGEATGPNTGKLLYVFTDPGGSWEVAGLTPAQKGGGAFGEEFDYWKVKWEAKVSVLCNCPCGIRSGTRIYDVDVGIDNAPWVVFNPAKVPMGVPLAKSILNGLGKILAYPVKQVLGKFFNGVLPDDHEAQVLINLVNNANPKDPHAGIWKGGKSPCDQ